MTVTPTEREKRAAVRMFQRPIDGNWTLHIARMLAEHREEILRRIEASVLGEKDLDSYDMALHAVIEEERT